MNKNFISTLLTCIGCLSVTVLVSCSKNEAKFFKATDPGFTYMGRTVADGDSAMRFNFPGSSIYTKFKGDFVSVHMRPGSGSFIVTLDNNAPVRWEFDDNTGCLSLDSLEMTEHTISIMLATEGYEHNPVFYGITTNGGSALQSVQLPEKKFLFVGNSITCGYGVEDSDPKNGFDYLTENHYKSYACITARTLGAQWHSISRSGIGIYRNYGDVREGSSICMRQQFHRTLFDNEEYQWDHSKYQPDVLFLNLGTNDTSLDNYDKAALQAGYDEFIGTVRNHYPNSKIVLLTGSMLSGRALEDVKDCLDNTCKACNENGDNNVYRFDMTPQNGSLGFGADYHPSIAQQQQMAEELIAYIKANL